MLTFWWELMCESTVSLGSVTFIITQTSLDYSCMCFLYNIMFTTYLHISTMNQPMYDNRADIVTLWSVFAISTVICVCFQSDLRPRIHALGWWALWAGFFNPGRWGRVEFPICAAHQRQPHVSKKYLHETNFKDFWLRAWGFSYSQGVRC